jgi:hypothetical protein
MKIEGYTITELSKALKITPVTVRQRLHVAGIEPILSEKVYPPDTLERLKTFKSVGRPPKAKSEDPAKAAKSAKKK